MDQWTGSKLEKEYVKAVYCHSAFLSYVRRVHPAKCWAWMKHKMELIFAGTNINKLIYADDTILMAEREELKSLLMKVKE